MFRHVALGLVLVLGLAPASWAQEDGGGARFHAGLSLGYRGGFSVQGSGMVSNFTPSFPVMVRLGLGRTSLDAGEPLAARTVFINDATNGVPQENGYTWDAALDVLYPVRVLTLQRAFVYGGLRYSHFNGNFKFVGGNEDFDITSNHWGFGAGLDTFVGLSRSIDLVLGAGLDYFFSSTLTGHDTAYNPDGGDVNPRNDYTYTDADAAVGQPKLEPLFMFGLNYNFR
ncbi:MAG TPA: hypothetical protein VLC48_10585 [Gemmatimonadota bacterium]|nr:hypothetical protein [Gemmatimonadota bacterium]